MIRGPKKIKLLVTGASGFIGQEVSRQLSLGRYHPRLMIRQAGDDCEICHLDADFVMADLRDPESLKQADKGVDGIIHLAARDLYFRQLRAGRLILPGRGKNIYTHLHVADAAAAIIACAEQASFHTWVFFFWRIAT